MVSNQFLEIKVNYKETIFIKIKLISGFLLSNIDALMFRKQGNNQVLDYFPMFPRINQPVYRNWFCEILKNTMRN